MSRSVSVEHQVRFVETRETAAEWRDSWNCWCLSDGDKFDQTKRWASSKCCR
jgi:hypothetical protein